MVALKNSSDIESFLGRPDPRRPIVLVFGPDLGLVRERADSIVKVATGGKTDDAFSVVALEGDVIAADPARLSDEARTIGLFGGNRVVRVRAGNKSLADALKPLLSDPPAGALIVIEAGDLKKNAPLRTLCESSPAAAAIPCYADGERDLLRLVERTLSGAGMSIDADARDALVGLLGADRLATRAELDKLVLFSAGSKRIGLDDVQAVIADASALALDDAVDAAAAGDPEAALTALAKTQTAGIPASVVLGAAIRNLALLHRLSLELERLGSASEVVDRTHPKIHFRRKPLIERALSRLGTLALAEALVAFGGASLSARRQAPLADAITERALLSLARMGKRRGRA